MTLATLAPGVRVFLFILAAILVGMTPIPYILQALRRRDLKDMRDRAWSWWPVTLFFVVPLLLGPPFLWAAMAGAALWSLRELLQIQARPVGAPVAAVGYALVILQFVLGFTGALTALQLFLPLGGLAALAITALLTSQPEGFQARLGAAYLAVMAAAYPLSHLCALVILPEAATASAGSLGLFLFVAFLGQFNDLLQYLWGKALGRRKLLPTVSPGKTWEGFLGAAVTSAALGAALAGLLTPFSRPEAAALALLIAVLGLLGDLTISAIKRDVGVKDTGDLLPGFGGLMDRLDSVLYAAPVCFYYVGWMHGH